jgi:hypothetical protein
MIVQAAVLGIHGVVLIFVEIVIGVGSGRVLLQLQREI